MLFYFRGRGCISKSGCSWQNIVQECLATFPLLSQVLAAEIFANGQDKIERTLFVWFTLLSGQSGSHAPTQTFTGMVTQGAEAQGSYEGLHLQLQRLPFVKPQGKFRAPMHRATCGAFKHYTEQELSLYISECLGEQVGVGKVVVRRLLFTEVSLDVISIAGVSEAFAPIVIVPQQERPDAASRRHGRSRGHGCGGRRDPRGNPDPCYVFCLAGVSEGGVQHIFFFEFPHAHHPQTLTINFQGRCNLRHIGHCLLASGPDLDFMDLLEDAPRRRRAQQRPAQADERRGAEEHQQASSGAVGMDEIAAALGVPVHAIQDTADISELAVGAELQFPEEFAGEAAGDSCNQ